MTRVRIMSDLHLEFGPLEIEPAGEDVLVLAGDVGVHLGGLAWAEAYGRRAGVPVVYVAGNHEFYRTRRADSYTFFSTIEDLRSAFPGGSVHVLERSEATVAGIRFVGATLWTNFALTGNAAASTAVARLAMNDYRRIFGEDGKPIDPDLTCASHAAAIKAICGLPPSFSGKPRWARRPSTAPLVVVTHHAPSRRSIAPAYAGDLLNPAFASDLDELVAASGALWIHGHVHSSFDYRVGAARVIANPRGYHPHELNSRFDPNLIVEL